LGPTRAAAADVTARAREERGGAGWAVPSSRPKGERGGGVGHVLGRAVGEGREAAARLKGEREKFFLFYFLLIFLLSIFHI
jgi:hypothetical protein